MATINGARVGLYVVLWLFSAVLLGLTATRLHYTLHLPPGDPLNNGNSFYDPIVAELLVTSVLGLLWSSFMYVIDLRPLRAPLLSVRGNYAMWRRGLRSGAAIAFQDVCSGATDCADDARLPLLSRTVSTSSIGATTTAASRPLRASSSASWRSSRSTSSGPRSHRCAPLPHRPIHPR
ncbi:hypothetical protein NUW54_g7453 [Trametes sanguinea]|uniref:Uncharacterized protein n=1 Tax=Trametes sanguinea TaxID=158606 RepID=A0ACC1PN08_9APHY|nr:hypothetical protein NUW54_g7453 [Trametes sanguinea]